MKAQSTKKSSDIQKGQVLSDKESTELGIVYCGGCLLEVNSAMDLLNNETRGTLFHLDDIKEKNYSEELDHLREKTRVLAVSGCALHCSMHFCAKTHKVSQALNTSLYEDKEGLSKAIKMMIATQTKYPPEQKKLTKDVQKLKTIPKNAQKTNELNESPQSQHPKNIFFQQESSVLELLKITEAEALFRLAIFQQPLTSIPKLTIISDLKSLPKLLDNWSKQSNWDIQSYYEKEGLFYAVAHQTKDTTTQKPTVASAQEGTGQVSSRPLKQSLPKKRETQITYPDFEWARLTNRKKAQKNRRQRKSTPTGGCSFKKPGLHQHKSKESNMQLYKARLHIEQQIPNDSETVHNIEKSLDGSCSPARGKTMNKKTNKNRQIDICVIADFLPPLHQNYEKSL